MTDFINTLNFNIRLTGIEGNSFQSRTRQNVKKPIGSIVYLQEPPADAVKLSYVGSVELNAERDLYLGDRSDELNDNVRVGNIKAFIATINPISLKSKNFIATQKFNTADSGDIPLYFKHTIEDSYDAVIPESLRIFDKDFNEVSREKYKLELIYNYNETTGAQTTASHYEVYNNLESSYNSITGDYEVYFIQYTNNSGSTEEIKTFLLQNALAYTEAGFDDIWAPTLGLKPWVDSYLLDDTSLVLTMPKDTDTAVRYEETKRLRVYPPAKISDTDAWYLRVINGNFNSGYGPYSFTYKIPEFDNQAFNPISPYKLAVATSCKMMDNHLIKLTHENIQFGSLFSSLYITIKDSDDKVIYAITNDSTYDGTDYLDFDGTRIYDSDNEILTWSTDLLLGIDILTGIVQLDVDLLTSYTITATYSYEEETYTVTSLNMNPVFDQEAAKETRAIYLVPSNCPTNPDPTGQTEAVRWLKISSSGKILSTNQDGSDGNENLQLTTTLSDSEGTVLTGIVGLHYSWKKTTTALTTQEIYFNKSITVSSTDGFPRNGWLRFVDNSTGSVSGSGIARYVYYDNKTDQTFKLSNNSGEVPNISGGVYIPAGGEFELVNFINERTNLSNRDYDTELTNRLNSTDIPVHVSRYFLLTNISINPPHSVDEAIKIDVRENGGGIRPEKYDEAKQENPKVQWYSDTGNYNGQIYPGKAALVIKLPISIKESFTPEQIKDIVEDNIPYGVQPLIRYYGYRPEIISVLPDETAGSIEIQWTKMGSEFTYDIWYTTNKVGPWIKHNTVRLTDDILDIWTGDNIHGSAPYEYRNYNLYNLTGLQHDTKYYIKVTCEDKYYQWWYSYSGPNSIEGGFGSLYNRPTPSEGNIISFQINLPATIGYGSTYGTGYI